MPRRFVIRFRAHAQACPLSYLRCERVPSTARAGRHTAHIKHIDHGCLVAFGSGTVAVSAVSGFRWKIAQAGLMLEIGMANHTDSAWFLFEPAEP